MTDHEPSDDKDRPSPTGMFLVSCLYDEGAHPGAFRVVRASSRRAVAEAILADPYRWAAFLRAAGLFEAAAHGDGSYYEESRPVSAGVLLARIDASRVDGDSRAQVAILPVPEIEAV